MLDTYLNVIRTAGGSVEKLDVWGRRRLSYEIEKKAEASTPSSTFRRRPSRGRAGPPAATQRVRAAHQGHPAGSSLIFRLHPKRRRGFCRTRVAV